MLRVVLDTNVFVSSLLVKSGFPAQVLDAWRARHYLLITSPDIMAEIHAVLNYPRIRRKYAITDENVEQSIGLLKRDALTVSGSAEVAGAIPADSVNEMVLAAALDGQADCIVSGDQYLLSLGEYRGIQVLSVRQLLTRLATEKNV